MTTSPAATPLMLPCIPSTAPFVAIPATLADAPAASLAATLASFDKADNATNEESKCDPKTSEKKTPVKKVRKRRRKKIKKTRTAAAIRTRIPRIRPEKVVANLRAKIASW